MNHHSKRRIRTVAAGAVIGVIAIAVMVQSCGGTDRSPSPAPPLDTTIRSTKAPKAPPSGGPPVRVPTGALPAPKPTRQTPTRSRPKAPTHLLGGGIAGMITSVAWPERRAIAEQVLTVAPILATLYGRDRVETIDFMRPRMDAGALEALRGAMGQDPPPAGTPVDKVRVIAANLRNDPSTGARSSISILSYRSPKKAGATVTVRLEFAPSGTLITDWSATYDAGIDN